MGVALAWKSFGGTLMWVQLTNHIQLILLSWWGDHSPRVWNGQALPGKRTVTGLETAKSSVCIAPHLCCTLGQPLRAPATLLFIYIYYVLDAKSFYVAYCLFDSEIPGMQSMASPLSTIPLALLPFLSSSSWLLRPLHFWLTLVLLSAERRRCIGENLQPRHYYCLRK